MMIWNELAQNWGTWFERIRNRFPHVDPTAREELGQDQRALLAHIAKTHELTVNEAKEEFNDFLYIETLARDAPDYRAHQAALRSNPPENFRQAM